MSRLRILEVEATIHLLFPCGSIKSYPKGIVPRGIKVGGKRPIRALLLNRANYPNYVATSLMTVLDVWEGRVFDLQGDIQCLDSSL